VEGFAVALWSAAADAAFDFEFMACDGAVASDLSRGQVEGGVPEDVGCKDVDETHDEDCDSAADDEAPEGHAKGLLGGIRFVEVCEHAVPEKDLGCPEHDEARLGTEEGPIAGEVGFEER